MPTLDLERSKLSIKTSPGVEHDVVFTFPADFLDGSTWTATAGEGDAAVDCPTDVDDDVLTVTIPPEASEDLTESVRLLIVNEDGLGTVGRLIPSRNGTASPTSTEVTITLADAAVAVSIIGYGPGAESGGPGGGGLDEVDTTDTATIDFDGDGTSGDPLTAIVKAGSITAAHVAADVATQAELDAEAAARAAAVAAEATLARNADNLTSGTVADARIASTIARDSEVASAISSSEAGQVRDGDAAGGVLAGTYPNPAFAADMATQAELDAHLNDTSDAHDASAISIADPGNDFDATDVEGALAELQADHETDEAALAAHLADTTDAHDASAVSFDDSGLIVITGVANVQTALAAVDAAIVAKVSDTAYDESTWNGVTSVAPSKNAVRDLIESIIDGQIFTGEVSVADLLIQGLTGATTDTRYVGGTTSGAPSSGTFSAGDWVVDITGQIWICTVAGSPGTWVAPGSGRLLGYAEITSSPAAITATGSGSRVDVAGLEITVTVGARPIEVMAYAGSVLNDTADRGGGIGVVEGTIGGGAGTLLQVAQGYSASANAEFNLSAVATLTGSRQPSAGSHTYKLMAWRLVGGNFTLTSGNAIRTCIRAIEL